jgi:hypothetical protein
MDWTEAHLQGDLKAMQQVREEAIVRAALERAAEDLNAWGDIYGENAARSVLALASDPAEVAAIIKKAGEDRR